MEGLRWSTRDQWHVTLRFFGELGAPQVELAQAAVAKAASLLPELLPAEGGPATRFLGPGLVVWPVEGLAGAAQAVGKATAKLGKPLPGRRFSGHLTLARGRHGTNLRDQYQLLETLSASWAVSSLSLVQSRLGPAGAKYEVLADFPLGGPAV